MRDELGQTEGGQQAAGLARREVITLQGCDRHTGTQYVAGRRLAVIDPRIQRKISQLGTSQMFGFRRHVAKEKTFRHGTGI